MELFKGHKLSLADLKLRAILVHHNPSFVPSVLPRPALCLQLQLYQVVSEMPQHHKILSDRWPRWSRECEVSHSPLSAFARSSRRFSAIDRPRTPVTPKSPLRLAVGIILGCQGIHLRDYLEELEAQDRARKDRRNKHWVVTHEDGTKFKIRAAKLLSLDKLH